jgi:hypothetical protein
MTHSQVCEWHTCASADGEGCGLGGLRGRDGATDWARGKGGRFCAAAKAKTTRVKEASEKTFAAEYEDGDFDSPVPAAHIKQLPASSPFLSTEAPPTPTGWHLVKDPLAEGESMIWASDSKNEVESLASILVIERKETASRYLCVKCKCMFWGSKKRVIEHLVFNPDCARLCILSSVKGWTQPWTVEEQALLQRDPFGGVKKTREGNVHCADERDQKDQRAWGGEEADGGGDGQMVDVSDDAKDDKEADDDEEMGDKEEGERRWNVAGKHKHSAEVKAGEEKDEEEKDHKGEDDDDETPLKKKRKKKVVLLPPPEKGASFECSLVSAEGGSIEWHSGTVISVKANRKSLKVRAIVEGEIQVAKCGISSKKLDKAGREQRKGRFKRIHACTRQTCSSPDTFFPDTACPCLQSASEFSLFTYVLQTYAKRTQ